MFSLLQISAVLLIAIAAGLALAHALELPGKLRLSKSAYFTVQSIYHPGFMLGGAIGEGGGLAALLLLLFLTPPATTAFWLTVAAFLALVGMHAVYWLLTQPVNSFWLQNAELTGASHEGLMAAPSGTEWIELRNQWEYSHAIRAALGLISLALLVAAVVC